MRLNRTEFVLMNNPLRAGVQRHVEAPRLLKLASRKPAGTSLEIGCGRGVGVEIILDRFGAERVDALDLDPRMVALAQTRLAGRKGVGRVWEGDVTQIPEPDGAYDTVFDFGIIHHVPDWRKAVSEVHRVLKPGGRFYSEEALRRFIGHPFWKRVLEHPVHDRFDFAEYGDALQQAGFVILGSRQLWGCFGWFVAERRG